MNTATDYRTDSVPTPAFRGFDPQQNVFLYDHAATPNREAALFFPLETYYPDDADTAEVPLAVVKEAFLARDAYLAGLQGEPADTQHPAMVAFADVSSRIRQHDYFRVTRHLFSEMLDGLSPDEAFDRNAPDPTNEDAWADFKSAYFDATGLLALVDHIDMPRMMLEMVGFRPGAVRPRPTNARALNALLTRSVLPPTAPRLTFDGLTPSRPGAAHVLFSSARLDAPRA